MDCKLVLLKNNEEFKNVTVQIDNTLPGFIVIWKNDNTRECVNIDNVTKIIPNDEPSYIPSVDVIPF